MSLERNEDRKYNNFTTKTLPLAQTAFSDLLRETKKNDKPVEKRKISYFVLARYLIQHWISPNQDDLSHSPRTFISGYQTGERPNTLSSAWDGDQNGRVSGRPCFAMLFSCTSHPVGTSHCGFNPSRGNMDTQRGNHLIYGFFASNLF